MVTSSCEGSMSAYMKKSLLHLGVALESEGADIETIPEPVVKPVFSVPERLRKSKSLTVILFDLETTGLSKSDNIIIISLTLVFSKLNIT